MAISLTGTGVTFDSGSLTTSYPGLGLSGQTWQSPGRALNTTYTNSTGRPIIVLICVRNQDRNNSYVANIISGNAVGGIGSNSATRDSIDVCFTMIVLNGQTYSSNVQVGGPGLVYWYEFR